MASRRAKSTGALRTHQKFVIAHHLVLCGYGHWLPNDPRGSGSEVIREAKLAPLAPLHQGRKAIQPSRQELRAFSRAAEPLLEFENIWFDDVLRTAVGQSLCAAIKAAGYTVWALAVLRNHVHACVRRHRDSER